MKILLLYYTRTGHTLEAATAVAAGIRDAGAEVKIMTVADFTDADLAIADALIVGSPCWLGNGPGKRGGVATPVFKALQNLDDGSLSGRRCGGFAVNGGSGGEKTVVSLGSMLGEKGCRDYIPGPVCRAGAPLSLWTGPAVTDDDRVSLRVWGSNFAELS